VNIEELIRDLASAGVAPAADDRQAAEAFAEACRQADEDLRERQRIRDINDLVDAEDTVYAQALAAVGRGDLESAEPLLRSSAEAGIGDAAWLLATVLERHGRAQDALSWYRRAAIDGDPRADDKIAGLHARPEPAPASEPDSGPRECFRVTADSIIRATVIKTAPDHDHLDILPCLALPATLGVLADSALMPDALRMLCRLSVPAAWQWHSDLAVHYARMIPELPRMSDWILPLRPAWHPAHIDALLSAGMTAAAIPAVATSHWSDVARLMAALAEPGSGKPVLAGVVAQACRPGTGTRELAAADMMLPLASVPAAAPGATLHEAMEQVLESGVRTLPVTEDADVVGVVTLADLAQAMHQARGLPSIQRVETLMQPPVTVPVDMPASAVMATAARSQAGLLVVTGPDGTPAGYLTPESLLTGMPGTVHDRESRPQSRSLLLPPELLEAVTK
jgi:CBS domain-containing protein